LEKARHCPLALNYVPDSIVRPIADVLQDFKPADKIYAVKGLSIPSTGYSKTDLKPQTCVHVGAIMLPSCRDVRITQSQYRDLIDAAQFSLRP
jgi:hypothetical protein